mgnify:FL=1
MGLIRKFIGNKIVEAAIKAGHVPAAIPANEEERLQDLKRLKLIEKNIQKDKRFSSFPKLAATLTGCTQSAIHILDNETQHCKVSYGKDLPTEVMTKEAPRELAICSHVLNNNSKPLVISDVSIDERTKHAYALAPNFPRFYAGSPIISNKGFTLGTFCVFDDNPKTLEHTKIDGLRMLADQFINIYESTVDPTYIQSEAPTDVEKIEGEYFSSATVLFSDFVGFTKKTEELDPGQLIEILDSFFSGFDKIMERFSIKKIKTIGDAYMAVGGIPDLNSDHADRTVQAAIEMINYVRGINFQQQALGNEPWEIRIGVHTGPIIAGKTSSEFDIWGDSVNIAARLENSGDRMRVNCSEETKSFLKKSYDYELKKDVELKGKGKAQIFVIKKEA